MPLAESLAPIAVTDPAGGEVLLGSLWSQQTVVLAFVRHFG